MAARLEYVRRGQPFRPPADDWNAFVDAARAHRGGQFDLGAASHLRLSQPSLVVVRNDAGEDLDQFAPVILDDILISHSDNPAEFLTRPPVFSAVAPTAQNLGKPLAILQQTLAEDAIGRAIVAGVTPAQVAVSDESHQYATISGAGLVSASAGPVRILWVAAGTGTQWAVLLFLPRDLPPYPDGDGSYVLLLTVDSGDPSIEWVSVAEFECPEEEA